jgi:hypothetical protein
MNLQSKIILLASALFIVSCSSNDNDVEEIKGSVSVVEDNTFNSDSFDFVLPQPISLAKAFQAAGITYVSGKTNPTSNKNKYNVKVKQLLNLGIYSADLAYCSLNDKPQEAREYLKAVQELGIAVGLEAVFSDKLMLDKFDNSLGDSDALESLIYDIQEKSEEYLQENDLRYLAVVQFAGSWVEGMYLGIDNAVKKDSKSSAAALVDQMNLLKNIIIGLKTYPTKDETMNHVISSMKEIQATYSEFESVIEAGKNTNFEAPVLSKTELQTLAEKIKKLRTDIVSVN